ncbi:Retinitis pigmentosa 1-like 1 protein [Dissostichus eleginoides]|uniref:Retinitis pigmentosa 1-like 1 protein n=1 Tax=Dissostichus eleginoides TaxID=100907 RepID=A0AAD9EPJ9_DISEL|nr:Retinitis pigmentosa 1-like 1 protein [Dissostichus eleginoides]
MHSVHTEMWDPQPQSKNASPFSPRPPSNARLAHVTTNPPAKRITFYKSGDSQFGGVKMAIHKRSFKCFDALLDDLSQKVPLPFGVRTVTTPRGTHSIKHLEQLQDGGCYLCSDRRLAKPVNMELASKRPGIWQRRILLVKNSDPGIRRSVVLSRRSTRSLGTFLDAVSEVMQFHVRKLYTAEGRRIDSVQSLMTSPGVLVCVGREAFSPMLVNFMRKSSEEKLPGVGNRSPVLGPRTPGNGARSPATQGVRSPPHGAHSRASEYSEVHESKKNVKFGLETKKSIIHPRSDSSNRSARFSLSSEKSYSNSVRPSIMNDDIEKRVVVNKDGSLSVEMRVRFRLHNDETLQWSTQVKKSPSLTNECQAPPHYLQQGQSESCSDPDSSPFDPEGVDYSNRNRVMEGNGCPCCYQRQEQQYDLWENPAHCHKHHPVPPPPASRHTITRHTRSSSSSSSCNSRRVVRCRARGSEPSKIVQEEMFVTEQVEVEQDGETCVEVCTVSRGCSRSEVVAIDKKSVAEEEVMLEDDKRPLSVISCSSHVLQSLKEDQDDELPPSASQCCCSIEPSPTHKEDEEEGKSRAASSAHCGADTPHPTADDRAPSSKSQRSRASDRSGENKIPNTEEEEDAEIKRVVSSLSQKSSSVCSNCGGCKCEANSESKSRASKRSDRSHKAPSKPPTPLVNNGSDDEGSECSVGSTQSNRSNITGRCSAVSHMLEERASSHMSSPEEGGVEEERASDGDVGEEAEEAEEERAGSSLSDKSGASVKTITKAPSLTGSAVVEEEDTNKRSPSALSDKPERPESVLSAKSAKSNVSAKSGKSHKSTCSHCARPVSAVAQDTIEPEGNGQEEGVEVEERAASATSAKSNLSAKSNKSSKALERSGSGEGEEERPASRRSGRSNVSVKSSKSCKSNGIEIAEPPCSEEKEDELVEDEEQRPESARSAKSASSVKSRVASPAVSERATSAMSVKSNISVKSSRSQKSAASPNPNEADIPSIETNGAEEQNEDQERVASALSVKSKSSAKSRTSHKSCNSLKPVSSTPLVDGEGKETTERAPSAASAKSGKSRVSTSSRKSNHNKLAESDAAETRGSSALSVRSTKSAKSGRFSCGKASALDKERKEEDEEKNEASEEASERAASVLSTKSQRKDSGDTEQPLSRNSSVSLGLAEDQETADSDSGKSSVCSYVNTEKKGRAKTATPQETRSTVSQNSRKSPHNCPEIPTINTPGGSQVKEKEGEEEATERGASAMSAKSSRSHKSSSRVKAAAKEQNELDVNNRTSSAMSSASVRGRSKSSASARAKKAEESNDNGAENQEKETDSRAESVDSKSGRCLKPESAVSAHSGSKTKASKQSKGEGSVKSSKAKSSVKSSRSQKKGVKASSPSPSHSSTLSQSLSAADLLKETMARPQSKNSVRSQRREEVITPACLPNASPNEVDANLPQSWKSSAAVMKVLLSSSMGRCKSMPEVSPVYGRKLSTSARGLLDCLTQLQLIDPAVGQQKNGDQRYEDVMVILQSLWLTEQKNDLVKEQVSPPRSSSGLGMSSGSAGSGKDNGNQEAEPEEKEVNAEAEPEEKEVNAEAEPEETDVHAEAEPEEKEVNAEAEPEELEVNAEAESEETDVHEEVVLPNMDSLKNTNDPSSSSANDSSKSPTDNERDTLDDSSSATPPTVVKAPLTKRQSQDPDPVWVMQLLKKLEKQFMNHYITAMSEFKVRWDLDDSLILDTMIGELRDEVSKRIQLSIQRELKKIQGRAGRTPRPPQRGTLSRESTMTDRRRRILKVMKNQPKTAESQSDGEMTGEFSDQRSEDDYCPCDECVRKKMAARPLRENPIPSAELPMLREFDLLKILQLKKSPSPVLACQEVNNDTEDGDAVEEVKPEEEDEEVKKRDVSLLHQFTKTSVESQSGSLEDIDPESPPIPIDSIEVPKMAGGGTGQRRSRSPGRVKCRKPKDNELDDQ